MRPPDWLFNRAVQRWLTLATVIVLVLAWIMLKNLDFVFMAGQRVPDPNNLPIYPGAQSISTRDNIFVVSKDNGNGQFIEAGTTVVGKFTDYQTNARPDEVLDFYKTVMPNYGWPAPTPLDDSRLMFVYIHTNWLTGRVDRGPLSVTVEAKTTSNGMTSVELNTGP
jgi:hypothetical protein